MYRLHDNEIKSICVFPVCIKSVFESINSIRHSDIVREAILLTHLCLFSHFYQDYEKNGYMYRHVDGLLGYITPYHTLWAVIHMATNIHVG